MAQKKITDLQLRDNVTDELNLVSDDGIQSYRITSAQMREFIMAANAVTRDKIAPAERLPRGTVLPFAGSTPPTGYLKCDGSAISRSTYSDLFDAIGTSFGAGNGSTTFNIPDLRGVSLRGLDDGRGFDSEPSRVLGSYQADAFQDFGFASTNRTSLSADSASLHANSWAEGFAALSTSTTNGVSYVKQDARNNQLLGAFGASGTPRRANETRVKNVAVNHIIKF
jgi:microcystin-dependent protein